MTTREIFTRFQNLNIAILMEDLRRGLVAREEWISAPMSEDDLLILCPIAHSCRSFEHLRTWIEGTTSEMTDANPAAFFVRDWDNYDIGTPKLLSILEEIWKERMEDADVVQAVCEEPKEVMACWPS
jgi:hypothetical protein